MTAGVFWGYVVPASIGLLAIVLTCVAYRVVTADDKVPTPNDIENETGHDRTSS